MNERQTQYATDGRALETSVLGLLSRRAAMVEREDPHPQDITADQYKYLVAAREFLNEFVKLFPQ